jgi:hypothetical protein
MEAARAADAREVERLYSDKPIRIVVADREYVLPRNYAGPKAGAERDIVRWKYLTFSLFLPDYGGYTKNNWQDGWFHEQLIDVIEVQPVDKNATAPDMRGELRKAEPASYGEPHARFKNRRKSLEAEPFFRLYGLEGYRRINHPSVRQVTWTGTRANGEFFFFDSSLPPGGTSAPGVQYPHCDVRYYSEKEDLFIAYRYKQRHIERWFEIDSAIWRKIHEWRAK